jgi:hypothetical protein
MKKLTMVLLLLASILNFTGCGEEDEFGPLLIKVTDGAYVLSEGTNPTNSRLSFYSVTNDTFYQSIYSGSLAYPNGLTFYGSDLLLVEQGPAFGGPGKLYQLDSNGGLKFSSNPFGSSPYSIALAGQRAYITNGPGSKVSVIELNGLTFVQDINVGVYPQEIIFSNGKIYVCNTSVFNGTADSTISIIDPNLNSVTGTLVLRKDPTSIKSTEENNALVIYAGCQGGNGMIYKISPVTDTKLDSFSLPNGFDRDLAVHGGFIYFISASNGIDRLNLSDRTVTTLIPNPGSGAYFYGYDFDVISGRHYVLDAKNFTVEGTVNIYNSVGVFEKSYTAGVGPRRVIFKIGTASAGS